MKTVQKLLSALLIAGTFVCSNLDAVRQRRAGQAGNYPSTKPATTRPNTQKPKTPTRKATDNWVDQHAANRLTHVANYLLNIKNSKDPQKRVELAKHIHEIAAALEVENPEKAKELLKAVPRLGGSGRKAQTSTKSAKTTARA